MTQEQLFDKLINEFDKESMRKYCLMTSRMFDLMYQNFSKDVINEYSYYRDYWMEKYKNLSEESYYTQVN